MPISVSAAPKSARTVYDNFKGVDFSKDALLVDASHSPYCLNMISDKGGQPEKRAGWRILTTIESPVNAVAQGSIGGESVILLHGGTKLYKWQNEALTELRDGLNNTKSSIFFADFKTKTNGFILTGAQYFIYDGETVKDVGEVATVPIFTIAKGPSGGGTQLNPLNLINPAFTEAFLGVAAVKDYQMSFGKLDATPIKAQVMNASGVFVDKVEGTDFSVNRDIGKITFVTPPGASPQQGEDNVKITAYRTVDGYGDRVRKCLAYSRYGIGGNNRIFITRNPAYKAHDWFSELNDPTYFPDLNYAVIGNGNTAIVGYAKLGENQLIIKEDNQQDTTVFSRSASLADNTPTFPVKIGITGTGAISPHSFAQLVDEPLFLARNGIYAVTSNAVTYERTLQNRSFYVDSKLIKEKNLQNATAVVWDNYYLVSINKSVYLLDSRQKSYSRENPNGFVYECFYWKNVNANAWLNYNGELYFGDDKGNFCKLNTDIQGMSKYNDNGEAITAIWSTKLDDDKMSNMTKTMLKKGCVITTKPFTRSSVSASYKTENTPTAQMIVNAALSILEFGDVDFNNFSFISNESARKIVLKLKVKKYQSLQFIIENSQLNQGFGIFDITKNYTAVNYIK